MLRKGDFYFEHVVKTTFGFSSPDAELLKQAAPGLVKLANVLDAHLKGKDYVACGRLTIADFALASMARYWRESTMPLEDFRNIVNWLEGLMRLSAWAEPWPG